MKAFIPHAMQTSQSCRWSRVSRCVRYTYLPYGLHLEDAIFLKHVKVLFRTAAEPANNDSESEGEDESRRCLSLMPA